MAISPRLFKRFYPDSSKDGTLYFYGLLHKHVAVACRILNLGAGPGDKPGSAAFSLRDLRGAGWRVCGCDLDPEVLRNAQLDEARVMEADGRIPYEDGAFDLIFADYVLEHVENPKLCFMEVYRVLKPGGYFFFRTPNLYHYVGIAARLLPHSMHDRIANRVRNLGEDAHDPYPTFHRMNTRKALRRLARQAGLSQVDLSMFEGEPSYLVFNKAAFLIGVAYERTVNKLNCLQGFRANIMGRIMK